MDTFSSLLFCLCTDPLNIYIKINRCLDKKKVRVYVVLIVIHTDEYATMFYFCFCVTSKKRTKANTNHSLKYFCCINNKIHSKTSEQLIINVSTVSRDCEQFYLINEIVFLIFITNCKQEILFILMQPLSSITAYHWLHNTWNWPQMSLCIVMY
jgi:hypothetical protein